MPTAAGDAVCLTRRGLKLPRAGDAVPPGDLARTLQMLTVTPLAPEAGMGKAPPAFKAYAETQHAVYIPRFFDGVRLPAPASEPAAQQQSRLQFCGSLRPAQANIVAAGLQQCRQRGGGLLVLPTGFGKTVCALWIACALGVRTLVLAHKSFLLDQWAERIGAYVPQARIGRVQQNVVDVQDKDIVLGMLQSISKRDYDGSTFEGFGLTIVDECHHISAPVFSKAMFKTTSKYMLGLSATPDRKDGLGPSGATPLLSWFLGPIISDQRGQGMPDDVVVRVVPYHCSAYDLPPPMMRGGMHINLPKIITGMVQDEQRNQLLLSLLEEAVAAGRKVLCLSERRAHCQELLHMFNGSRRCNELQKHASLYLGGMKPAELAAAAASADVLMASYGLASEGLDIPTLDTLIMCTSRSSIEQSVGRVLRGAPNPLVVDVLDRFSVCFAQFNKRKAYYAKCGFSIRHQGPAAAEQQGYAFVSDDDDDAVY
ncbi:hypothetical protein OEZ85_011055 [Tetradesmus obliquus]|uniref:Helicase ATP-binding domain-containing protein n=1 Tax=Tetradesmus obliquus TaxID=3088 RepID=A0ABY8TP38_TETOB|nr:hypothetical protein OEZ85_011055 [Tetradesmus obliquus]